MPDTNSLTILDPLEALKAPDADLETLMVALCKFGQPRLSRMDRGWHASMKMNTDATGAKFEIQAEFTHTSPGDAMTVLCDRVHACLVQMRTAIAPD